MLSTARPEERNIPTTALPNTDWGSAGSQQMQTLGCEADRASPGVIKVIAGVLM